MLLFKKINIINILFFALFFLIFFILYQESYPHYKINFEQKVININHKVERGQIYYSNSNRFLPNNVTPFVVPTAINNKFISYTLPIYSKSINAIRFDPLNDKGEVIIKNVYITEGALFNKKIYSIDLSNLDSNSFRYIKIIKKDKNSLHILILGRDPHLVIASGLNLSSPKINFLELFKIALLSLFILLILVYIYHKYRKKELHGEEILTSIAIISYTIYTLFFSTEYDIASYLFEYLPIIALLIIFKQGISNYYNFIKNTILIFLIFMVVIYIDDYFNGRNTIINYFHKLKDFSFVAIIIMMFMQKREFNYNYYKKFLFYLTIAFSTFATLLHFNILEIDTIIIKGYTMSMSAWAQKNYTFWYLFLMWGTISFFDLKKEKLYIFIILFFSVLSIFTGYSSSAKLAFIVSLFIYFAVNYTNFSIKILKLFPIFLALYFLFFPWILDILVNLSKLHHKLAYREAIFAIYGDIIKNNLLFGTGFYSFSNFKPSDLVSNEILELYKNSKYMKEWGVHGQLLSLWLSLGLIGILPLSIILYKSLNNLIEISYKKYNLPSLLALIVSFIIIVTFSWGDFSRYALLTFSFFMGMIFLSLNIAKESYNAK